MASRIVQLVEHCLSLLRDQSTSDEDRVFIARFLLQVPNEAELRPRHWDEIEDALRTATTSFVRVAMIELLVHRESLKDARTIFEAYVDALEASGLPMDVSRPGATLGDFYARHEVPGGHVWSELLRRFGSHVATRLLSSAPKEGLPRDALERLSKNLESRTRTDYLWDFVVLCFPNAWRYSSAKRPTLQTTYWHALQDWPIYGSKAPALVELVEQGIVTKDEASILGDFGARLSSILDSYGKTPPSEAVLIADERLARLGTEALERFFPGGALELLTTIYRVP